MTMKLVAIEMFRQHEKLGRRLTICTNVGAFVLEVDRITVVPEHVATQIDRDYKSCARRVKGEKADIAVEAAAANYRAQFLSTYGGRASEAVAKARDDFKRAEAKLAEAERIAAEVDAARKFEPVHRSVSQPLGRK